MENGSYEIYGSQHLGAGEGGQGVFVQNGGTVRHPIGYVSGIDNNWTLASGKGSVAQVLIAGGIHTNNTDTSICMGVNSRTVFTVEGGEYVNLRPANPNRCITGDSYTIINLNGGVFGAQNVSKARKDATYAEKGIAAKAYCNFNGGTFLHWDGSTPIFGEPGGADWNNAIDRVTVYEKGATIEVRKSKTASVKVPISAPTGMGVASIAWEDTGVRYVGSPVVEIIGDGTGASAFAQFDSATRRVTGIKVTSPGCDYTWAKAVIRYANEAVVTNTAVVLARFASGSLTKKGPGKLSLNAPNTYTGDTVIEEGLLEANVAGAIPAGSKIVFKGGTVSAGAGVALPAAIFRFDALGHVTYPGAFEFPAGSGIEIVNLDKIEKSAGDYVIATFTGGLLGALPKVSNAEDLPEKWGIFKSCNSIKLRYLRGMVLSVR
jgi:autotransporter-associated beta strand protein